VPGLGYVPVPVTVWCVAVRAEARVVVEPGSVDLGEGQGRPERFRDQLRPARIDGIAAPVVRGDSLEEEVPSLWIAVQQEGASAARCPTAPTRRGARPVPQVRCERKAIRRPRMAGSPPFPSP
jgi:hypothetical protein